MRPLSVLALVVAFSALAAPAHAQDLVAKTEHRSPADSRKAFNLPPGFEIQLVAAEPDINKPMNIAFDAKGRLWVTSTIEYPYPAKDGTTPRDKVIVLSDFADDGRARKVETFAEGLNIPLGVLPIEKGALVFAIDHIRKFTDTDGDGKADKSEKFLGNFGNRDTHGMTNHFTVGFDGWVYANHGFSNDSEVTAKDGSSIKMNSGNCYRFTRDGSRVEYFAHGQVNPFGLAFDAMGNLYSADCHTRPQYLLLRGAYYPSFGKPDDGLGFGPEMCPHDHGSTGIAGTVYYAASQFPPAYHGTLFNGNPVTNKVNHDRIEWFGSSPRAVEQPDFLTSEDPWFRPVDLVLGPDGALYIADFYNRIIGHYEVPLEHPGRDRTSGRIWRVVWRGEDGKREVPKIPDLSKASVEELVGALGNVNLPVRMTAARQLVERVGSPATDALKRAAAQPAVVEQYAQALWVLHQLGALAPDVLAKATTDPEPLARVHAMRIISEMAKAPPALVALARERLADPDPHVRRAAADALGRQPAVDNVRALLDVRREAHDGDTHLIHVARMALRDQLESRDVLARIPELNLSDDEQRGLADVVVAATSPDAGALLMSLLRKGITDPARTVQLLVRAARSVPAGDVDSLTQTVLERFPNNLDVQRQLFVALLEGLAQRGAAPGDATRRWGTDLAKRLATFPKFDAAAWTFQPLPASPETSNPWTPQQRPLNVSGAPSLWSSHPKGEKLTGFLRSRPFAIPPILSFKIAGHYGPPATTDPSKSFVRLKLAEGDETVAEVAPPRDDTPQSVTWDLSKWAGKQGYIEAVDGDDRPSYAWLAFGQFEPAVAATPAAVEDARDRIVAASLIARALKLAELRGRMEEVVADPFADATARAGAARALGTMGTAESVAVLAKAAADPSVPPAVREAVSQSLAEQNSPAAREGLLSAIAVAPEPLQRSLAASLAGNREGGDALLAAVAAGKASPRLLQDAAIAERLKAAGVPDLDKRIATLTKGLVPADEAIRKLLEQRRARFDPGKASATRGAEVFAKNCAACHRVGEVGAVIGPQLDGLGVRGAERIIEDVLDPNRNVDGAFRTTILRLKAGDTVSGLLRREEGELIVLADTTGKEISVEKSKVGRRAESSLSLMPGNFGEILKPEEFNDLAAFLLSK